MIFVLTTTATEGHMHVHELACMHEHISIAWLVLSIGVATMTDKKALFLMLVDRIPQFKTTEASFFCQIRLIRDAY